MNDDLRDRAHAVERAARALVATFGGNALTTALKRCAAADALGNLAVAHQWRQVASCLERQGHAPAERSRPGLKTRPLPV